MLKKVLFLAVAICLLFVSLPPYSLAADQQNFDGYWDISNPNGASLGIYGIVKYGESFTATANYELDSIFLRVINIGSGENVGYNVEIYAADQAHKPTGNPLATSQTVMKNDLPAYQLTWWAFNFPTPTSIFSTWDYVWIISSLNGSGTEINHIAINNSFSTNPYAGGVFEFYFTEENGWTISADVDFYFINQGQSLEFQASLGAATNITSTTADLHSSITNNSGITIQANFMWTDAWGTWKYAGSSYSITAGTHPFDYHLVGLSPKTLYYYTLRINYSPIVYYDLSSSLYFTTLATPGADLIVVTRDAYLTAGTEVVFQGELVAMTSGHTILVSFEYGETTEYGTSTPDMSKTTTGGFATSITLAASKTYHFRAVAVDDQTSVNGEDKTIATLSTSQPIVLTMGFSYVSGQVRIEGYITDLGGQQTVSVAFDVGLTTTYGQSVGSQTVASIGYFYTTLANLTANTTYHYRAKATSTTPNYYGEDKTFLSPGPGPIPTTPPEGTAGIITGDATEVSVTAATLNAHVTGLGVDVTTAIVRFRLSTTEIGLVAPSAQTNEQTVTAAGDYHCGLIGLTENTKYFFIADLVTSTTYFGAVKDFTTSQLVSSQVTKLLNNNGLGDAGGHWLVTGIMMVAGAILGFVFAGKIGGVILATVALGASIALNLLDYWLLIILGVIAISIIFGLIFRSIRGHA